MTTGIIGSSSRYSCRLASCAIDISPHFSSPSLSLNLYKDPISLFTPSTLSFFFQSSYSIFQVRQPFKYASIFWLLLFFTHPFSLTSKLNLHSIASYDSPFFPFFFNLSRVVFLIEIVVHSSLFRIAFLLLFFLSVYIIYCYKGI